MGSVTDTAGRESLAVIAFVGCGINALAASIALLHNDPSKYDVQIFEKRAQDVTADAAVAGLHLKPNSSRLLNAWGVSEFFEHARVIRATKISRYADGSLISVQQRPTGAEQDESKARNTETWYINRGDLWSVLYKKATALGAKVYFNKNVTELDPERPSLRFSDGIEVSGDLVVGADGKQARPRLRSSGLRTPQVSIPGSEAPSSQAINSAQRHRGTSCSRSASPTSSSAPFLHPQRPHPSKTSTTTTRSKPSSVQAASSLQQPPSSSRAWKFNSSSSNTNRQTARVHGPGSSRT